MGAPDAPDWSGQLFPPPLSLGTVTMPHGLSTNTAAVTLPEGSNGILVLAASAGPVIPARMTVQIIDPNTGAVLAEADGGWQETVTCFAGVLGVAGGTAHVLVTWDAANTGVTTETAQIWAAFGSEVQQVAASAAQPLPVTRGRGANRIITATDLVTFATAGNGDQLVNSYTPQTSGPRYVRKASMLVAALGTVATSGWSLYVKGTTTNKVITLVQGVAVTGISGYTNRAIDLEDHPIDLALALPGDPTVQLRLNNPANTVAAADAVITL